MTDTIRPSEISEVLLSQLRDIGSDLQFEEVGHVLQVSDGVVRIQGLLNAEAGELLQFDDDIKAVVMNLEEDNVGAVLLGPTDRIKEGMTVRRTGRIASINVGESMVGRVVNPLGEPLDGKGRIEGELCEMPLERKAPGVKIYPMLSPDGSKLYFSSAGLHGVGGYDIYVSEKDPSTGDWSVPVNMGFPYSSPADDFLFASSEDSRYSVFASNRDCPQDSVYVYVLEYDTMPVRRSVTDPDEMREIAELAPAAAASSGKDADVKADVPENVDTRRYMEKMSEVRALRDSIDRLGLQIEDARLLNDEEAVLDGEFALVALQDSLSKVSAILQQIEMEFLFSGVVIDPDKLMAEADKEMVAPTADYVFAKNSFGKPLSLNMLDPIPEFDYSFKILEEGQFAEDQTLPSGLVYQIQMFLSSSQVTVSRLKGLSPVFETKTPTGKYIYRVGVFRTYADVLSNLNSVKRAGFKSAFIVAFNDGKELTVSKARALEAEKKSRLYEVRIETGSEDLDPAVASGIRQQASGKDIARVENEDGTKRYVVGPFSDKSAAENLVTFIRAMGAGPVSCVEIPQK